MSKVLIPVTLILFSLLALSVAERRLDNAKEIIEARDGHGEEHRPKKLFGKFKRPKSQYGPPKAHHPKKQQYGPPPHVYGAPQPVGYGPPSQAYGHPKHPPPQATPAYHAPQPVVYSRPGPAYGPPPKASYGPPTYASPPQAVYNRPSPVNPVYNPPQPAYPQPVPTYSQPAPPKPEVPYSPPAPSYGHQQAQVNHQPASYGTPDHDDSHEDDRKPSDDLPLTSVYNVPYSAHVELPTPTYGSAKPYEPAEPKPIVTPVFIKAELTGNRYQQSAEKLPETPVYKPASVHSSSQSENHQPQLEDDPPKQTAYNSKKPSYSDDSSDDHSPVVTGSTDSSNNHDDDYKFSPPSESDFPSLFDHTSNFYKQSENAPETNDHDFGFFQLGVFSKTSNFFEQNYKG